MKKLVISILSSLFVLQVFAVSSKTRAAIFTSENNYSIQLIGVGTGGTKYIKVSGTGKKQEGAVNQARMNAIHACIFKGIPGTDVAQKTPPLYHSSEPSMDDEAFFDEFFAPDGPYLQFLLNTNDDKPDAKDVSDVGHGYMKVKIKAQVNFDGLRDYLKDKGIIKGFADALEGTAKPTIIIFPKEAWCKTHNYTNDMGDADFNKALMDKNMTDLIAEFEKFMAEQNYQVTNLQQSLKAYEDQRARNSANDADGNTKNISAIDKISAAVNADMRVEFDYVEKSESGKNWVEFTIGVYDSYSNKTVYANPAKGSAVYGTSQMVNQLKEAILSIKDEFLSAMAKNFNNMAKEGREIVVLCDRYESCDVSYVSQYDGYPLGELISYFIETKVMENSSFTTKQSSGNVYEFTQVHIPLMSERVNPISKKKETKAQYAKDFGMEIARFIKQTTGTPCYVEQVGPGKVVITLGQNALYE